MKLADGRKLVRDVRLPGDRAEVRDRSTTVGDAPAAAPAERGGLRPLSGPRARMFLALDLPAEARSALAAWRDGLVAGRDDLRPVRPEALHVTLVFLGWQDEAAAEAIGAGRLRGRGAGSDAPLAARRTACGRCRRATRACSRSTSTTSGDRASAVQAAASDALCAGGWYRPEKRPFWPHVTLARVKRGRRRVPALADAPAAPGQAFAARGADALPLDAAAPGRALRAARAGEAAVSRLHRSAEVGFARSPGAYERGRPEYPAEAVRHFVELLAAGAACSTSQRAPAS